MDPSTQAALIVGKGVMDFNNAGKAPGGVNVISNPGDNSFLLQILQQMQAQSSPDAMNQLVQGVFKQGMQGAMPGLINQANSVGVRANSSTTAGQLQDDLMSKLTSAATAALQTQQANTANVAAKYGDNTKTNTVVQTAPGKGPLGCYVTTAVCEEFNLPDDCEELQVLRKWRDEVLAKTQGGLFLIQHYYETAPKLLAGLGDGLLRHRVLVELRRKYILPAVAAIKAGNDALAFILYVEMLDTVAAVEQLKSNKE